MIKFERKSFLYPAWTFIFSKIVDNSGKKKNGTNAFFAYKSSKS